MLVSWAVTTALMILDPGESWISALKPPEFTGIPLILNVAADGKAIHPELRDRNHEFHESHEMREGWDAASPPPYGESVRVRK